MIGLTVLVAGQVPDAVQVCPTVRTRDNDGSIHGIHKSVYGSKAIDVQAVQEMCHHWLDLEEGPRHVEVNEQLGAGTEDVILIGNE